MNSPGAYVYLLHGEDTFSRDETLKALKERMRALPAGEHNITELSGDAISVRDVRGAADAAPFLADRRMVVVHGLLGRLQGKGKAAPTRARAKSPRAAKTSGADDYQELIEYLPSVPSTSSLVFVEGALVATEEIERALPKGRAYVKAFPRVRDVPAWVRQRARSVGVNMDEGAVRELAMLGGEDLMRLNNEIQKLAAYAGDRTITRQEVRDLVVGRDLTVWALLDALAERRVDGALEALQRLYRQGESPEALLARDVAPLYRRLLAVKELSAAVSARRTQVDPSLLGLNPRTLPRMQEQAARFSSRELERALELLLDLDRGVKTGQVEPEVALELLIVRLCSRLGSSDAEVRAERRTG